MADPPLTILNYYQLYLFYVSPWEVVKIIKHDSQINHFYIEIIWTKISFDGYFFYFRKNNNLRSKKTGVKVKKKNYRFIFHYRFGLKYISATIERQEPNFWFYICGMQEKSKFDRENIFFLLFTVHTSFCIVFKII